MKKTLLYSALAILIGGWLGTMMVKDPGYVLIAYGDSVLQTSLWFAVLAGIVTAVALRILFGAFRVVRDSGDHFNLWRSDRRKGKARRLTTTGLIHLVEGNWPRARKYLAVAAGESEMPLINFLGAARAAHELGNFEERDQYLRAAHERIPEADLAIGLTQAQLQYSKGQLEQCLATLKRLPDKPYVTRMLARVYEELGEWRSLWTLLPALRKRQLETAETLAATERRVAGHLFRDALSASGDSTVERHATAKELWRSLSRDARRTPALIGLYARCLSEAGAANEADKILIGALKTSWDDGLVDLFGALKSAGEDKRLKTAEKLLKKYPYSARLQLCLGRLALRAGETEKGKEYLRASLSMAESAEALMDLGELHAREGDLEESQRLLTRALSVTARQPAANEQTGSLPRAAIPMI